MDALGPETVTVALEPKKDRNGDPIPGTEQSRAVAGCAVYPRMSTEAQGTASTLIVGYTVLAPVVMGAITDEHEVTWKGRKFKVVGEPGEWTFLDGQVAGLQVDIERGTR